MKIFKHTKLLAAVLPVALTLGALSSNVSANTPLTIDATATYKIGADAVVNEAASATDNTSARESVDILTFTGDVNGNNIGLHTYGDDTGSFGARVSGNGVYDITSTISYSDRVENNTGIDQDYLFNFSIIPGELSVFGNAVGNDFAFADYSIDVFVENSLGVVTSIFNSAAALSLDASSGTSATTFTGDSILAAYDGSNTFNWSTFDSGDLSLGSLLDGDFFILNYNMTVNARGNFSDAAAQGGTADPAPDCDIDVGVDCNQNVINNFDDECGVECGGGFDEVSGGSRSRSGDPFGVNASRNQWGVISSAPSVSVPEPSSILLMSLGLAGLVGFSRRKRSK